MPLLAHAALEVKEAVGTITWLKVKGNYIFNFYVPHMLCITEPQVELIWWTVELYIQLRGIWWLLLVLPIHMDNEELLEPHVPVSSVSVLLLRFKLMKGNATFSLFLHCHPSILMEAVKSQTLPDYLGYPMEVFSLSFNSTAFCS